MNICPADRRLRIMSSVFILSCIVLMNGLSLQAVQAVKNQRSEVTTAKMKPFTVADSIEMTHLIDPSENGNGQHPKSCPDGSKFFAVTERGRLDSNVREYALLIYNGEKPSEKPFQVATFSSSSNRPGIEQPRWIDNERISLIGEDPGELPQLYFINSRTRQRDKITSNPFGVGGYAVSLDLKKVIYAVFWGGNEEANKLKEEHGFVITAEGLSDLITGQWKSGKGVYQVEIETVSTGRVQTIQADPFQAPSGTVRFWVSPDGKHAITAEPAFHVPANWQKYEQRWVSSVARELKADRSQNYRPYGLSQVMLVDMETGEIRPLVDAPSATVPSIVWSTNSRSVVVAGTYLPLDVESQDELAKRKALPVVAEFDIQNGSFRRVADIPKNQSWMIQNGDSRDTFLVNVAKDGEALPPLQFRKKGNEWFQENASHSQNDPGSNITVSEAIDRWPKLVLVEPASHHETVILDPNPQFRACRFGRAEVIHWTGKRGEPLTGGLVYPTDYSPGVRYPLVIQTHGFDPHSFLLDGSFTTAMAAQELANRGVAVLQLGDSSLDEEASESLDLGPVYQSQYESAIDYLNNLGIIDRDRVGLVGFSITGFQVRYALTFSQYHFAAATSAEGNDFGYWQYIVEGNFPGWVAQNDTTYGGPPWSNWKPWLDHSISFHYDKIITPLRLESDSNREVAYEWENFIALRRLHKPVELIFVPGGAHPVVRPWDRLTSQQGNVDWMTFWLKGEEDPDPAKAEQYARWRELKKLQEADRTASAATP
jgi:dipeptidyl aminopeptidase/acylaminoacyl peptidase